MRRSWPGHLRIVLMGMLPLAFAHPSVAGDLVVTRLAGATADGKYFAVSRVGGDTSCGLATALPKDFEPLDLRLRAVCIPTNFEPQPLRQWAWEMKTPEVRALVPLEREIGDRARIVKDPITYLLRLEILQDGRYWPVRVDETPGLTEVSLGERYGSPEMTHPTSWRSVAGFAKTRSGYLVSIRHYLILREWDDITAISEQEVTEVNGRYRAALAHAKRTTDTLRDQRSAKTGVFSKPAGPATSASAKRRRNQAVRNAVLAWETVAAYQSLGTSELRDALWLLGWLDFPTRRLEALRFYLGLRDNDRTSANALLSELEEDPDLATLAAYLKTAADPLRNLPNVAGHTLTDEELHPLTDDQIHWLHRAQWAAQGGYRFRDPALMEYFAGLPWYSPVPESTWKSWLAQPWMRNPDAPLLRANRPSHPAGACRESLEAILRAERTRGLSAPEL